MEFTGAYMYIVLETRHGLSASKCAGKIRTSHDADCHIEHLGDYLRKSVRKWEEKFVKPCEG